MYVNLILRKKETNIIVGDDKRNSFDKIVKAMLVTMGTYTIVMTLVVLLRNIV